ncbi:MAG TPA: hypothetical protein VMF58_13450 [Rhizomicrobium sp.]|nr:hypothetical protein [Rhizomicrobium sp.]
MSELDKWDSFYVIIGSAAGALIGLQFVVMTLIAERPSPRVAEASAAFSTPTIVHFCVVLAAAALVRMPWQTLTPLIWIGGSIGALGILYALTTMWRMRRQAAYKPDFEDWSFHGLLPLAAYAIFLLSAFFAAADLHDAMFATAGATLLLLFVGIHNAWDGVAYQVFVIRTRQETEAATAKDTGQSNGAGGRT